MGGRSVRSSCYARGVIIATLVSSILTPVRAVMTQRVADLSTGAMVNRTLPHVSVNVNGAPLRTVLLAIAAQAGLKLSYNEAVLPLGAQVTLHVHDVPTMDAFEQTLYGTGLVAQVTPAGKVFITPGERPVMAGGITGVITDAKTKQPLAGVRVLLDGIERAETSSSGAFQLTGVSAGTHTITVRRIGYARVARTVTVTEGEAALANITLDASAMALDQVVVTGTIIPTELKAVPNAITVITAKQIEERGITHIDQLFRGDVPGVFAMNQGSGALLDEIAMFSRGATALSGASAGISTGLTNAIKTYIDGVELANPQYLSQIDPKSIERIEILTGPQASTIYGSNAINGVMQIFTKRGTTSTPQLALNLLSGWVENNFSSALTPQHDYSAQVNGIEGRLSYNAGGSWNYVGPWTPAKQTTRTDGFGGARLEIPITLGRITADMTLRRGLTMNQRRGDSQQTLTGYRQTGWYSNISESGVSSPTTYTLTGQTLGFTLAYVPTNWWSNELELGADASDTELRFTARGYQGIDDTTLYLGQDHTDRHSLRYTTTARIPVASLAQVTVTAGADAWQNLNVSMYVQPQTLTGTLTGTTFVSRQPGHNTGGFIQTQLGVEDRLFLTYGLRAEWNPNFGADAQPNYAPRYGIAYTQEFGSLTAKLRGSYGRSTRPPAPKLKGALTIADWYSSIGLPVPSSTLYYWGNFTYYFANPELAPEYQQGGEGGLELYWGTRGSLVITRYNQTVDDLIASPAVDSVDILPTWQAIYGSGRYYQRQYQYLNVGSIRNQGWELQGNVNTGPLTMKGTYSWTKSRTIGVNPRYRIQFANQPQYRPGATFQFLPEHTWALGMTYNSAATTVDLNFTGTGRMTIFEDGFYFQYLIDKIRLPQNQLNVSAPYNAYTNSNSGYALADLTASHRFSQRMESVLQIQNLMDHYVNDYWAINALMGRQTKLGLRIRLQ